MERVRHDGNRWAPSEAARDLLRQSSLGAAVGVALGSALGWLLGFLLIAFGNGDLLARGVPSEVALTLVLGAIVGVASALGLLIVGVLLAVLRAVWPVTRELRPRTVYASVWVSGLLAVHGFFVVAFRMVRDITTPWGIALTAAVVSGAIALLVVWNLAVIRRARRSGRTVSRPILPIVLVAAQILVGYLAIGYLRARPWRATLDSLPGDLPRGSVSATRPMNVILISIDTLRSDHLSCYGYGRETSPRIDVLAREGGLFTGARSQSPWTLPSHATMFTSLYPSIHGARNFNPVRFLKSTAIDQLNERNVTLAEILRAAGYSTTAITSVAWLGRETGMMQGFESVDNRRSDNTATVVVDKGMRAIERSSDPFFLFLHFMDVHDYYSPHPEKSPWVDPSYRGKLSSDQGLLWFRADYYDEVSRSDLDYAVGRYDSAIRYVDGELGRLFDWLGRKGLLDSTLIVICSDHGEEIWDHGGAGHGYALWEEQLRVPLIVRPPSSFSIRHPKTAAPAGIIDVTPTILDYLGIAELPWMQGMSLRDAIETDEPPLARTFYAESPHTRYCQAIVRGSAKLLANRIPPFDLFNPSYLAPNIRAFYKFRSDELYHLDQDPSEQRDVSSEHPEEKRRLEHDLITHILESNPPVGASRTGTTEASPETIEQLRSLGYIH